MDSTEMNAYRSMAAQTRSTGWRHRGGGGITASNLSSPRTPHPRRSPRTGSRHVDEPPTPVLAVNEALSAWIRLRRWWDDWAAVFGYGCAGSRLRRSRRPRGSALYRVATPSTSPVSRETRNSLVNHRTEKRGEEESYASMVGPAKQWDDLRDAPTRWVQRARASSTRGSNTAGEWAPRAVTARGLACDQRLTTAPHLSACGRGWLCGRVGLVGRLEFNSAYTTIFSFILFYFIFLFSVLILFSFSFESPI
jgi:hypothetical protein